MEKGTKWYIYALVAFEKREKGHAATFSLVLKRLRSVFHTQFSLPSKTIFASPFSMLPIS